MFYMSSVLWYKPLIPALGRLSQKGFEFEAKLFTIARHFQIFFLKKVYVVKQLKSVFIKLANVGACHAILL